ncbi:MAG: hypothetical protein KAY24_14075 [Candidatus Eisenbacteria sp.]|nr:hypothetical protein [Candidatus Eisenbacteria bacterium]
MLTPSNFDYSLAQPHGEDVRFLAGTDTLDYWIEEWDVAGKPATTIMYHLAQAGKVSLKVYDIEGQLVRTLVDEIKPAGPQRTPGGVLLPELQPASNTGLTNRLADCS